MGKAKSIKSLNSGKSKVFFNWKFLLKKNIIRDIIIKTINAKLINFDPSSKNFVLNPSGIINLIIVILNIVKKALILMSNIKFKLIFVLINFDMIVDPIKMHYIIKN